jgi:hypothetical protein
MRTVAIFPRFQLFARSMPRPASQVREMAG